MNFELNKRTSEEVMKALASSRSLDEKHISKFVPNARALGDVLVRVSDNKGVLAKLNEFEEEQVTEKLLRLALVGASRMQMGVNMLDSMANELGKNDGVRRMIKRCLRVFNEGKKRGNDDMYTMILGNEILAENLRGLYAPYVAGLMMADGSLNGFSSVAVNSERLSESSLRRAERASRKINPDRVVDALTNWQKVNEEIGEEEKRLLESLGDIPLAGRFEEINPEKLGNVLSLVKEKGECAAELLGLMLERKKEGNKVREGLSNATKVQMHSLAGIEASNVAESARNLVELSKRVAWLSIFRINLGSAVMAITALRAAEEYMKKGLIDKTKVNEEADALISSVLEIVPSDTLSLVENEE